MATINFLKRKDSKNTGALGSVIAYCTQKYKTEIEDTGVRLVSGVNCIAQRAFKDFMDTKKQFNKTDGVQFYYAVQSFEENTDISPILAHQIAMEWVEECYPGYQALVCTHMDTDNIHSHIMINLVSSLDGQKIHQNKNDIERVRYVNDQLCMKYGLPVCEPKKKVQGITSKEYYAAKAGSSWKTQLAIDIDNAMLYAKSKTDFIKLMNRKGYRVIWTSKRDTILYECPNGKMCRDFKLHEDKYLKGAMENEFAKRKEFLRRYEGYDEAGADAADLRHDNRRKLEESDRSAGSADFHSGTAAEHTENDDNHRTDGRDHGKSGNSTSIIHTEVGRGDREFQYGNDEANKRNKEQSQGNDERDLLTGWENERRFFEQSFNGERIYERYVSEAKDRQLDSDGNADLIPWSIRFMGNFADLLNTGNRRYRRKRFKLSEKNIQKRLARGQKTSGYEEYEDDDYTMSM